MSQKNLSVNSRIATQDPGFNLSILLRVFRHFLYTVSVDDGPNCVVTFPPLSYTSLFLSPPLKGATDMSAVITSMFKSTYDARAARGEEIY